MVPRGIEPRCPVFQAGAYTHSAKAPFVVDKYWLILIFSSPNCICYKQIIFFILLRQSFEGFGFDQPTLKRRRVNPPSPRHFLCYPPTLKLRRVNPPSQRLRRVRADEERLELSTLPLTTGRSAIELFILVGLVRFELTTPRLKAGYICQLSYKPIFHFQILHPHLIEILCDPYFRPLK